MVEVENREVARINLHIDGLRKTEIRKDIDLEWKSEGSADKPGSDVARPLCARPEGTRESFMQAQELLAKRDYRGGAPLFEKVVKSDPKDFEAWTDLGTAQSLDKKQKEAETSFRRALEANPAFLVAQLNLGKLYLSKQEPDKAIEVLGKTVETSPASADANFYLGEAYLQIKKGSKGVGYLEKAIQLDPVGKAEAHLRHAALYNAAGLKDKAVAGTEMFLAKVPDHKDRKKLEQFVRDNKRP